MSTLEEVKEAVQYIVYTRLLLPSLSEAAHYSRRYQFPRAEFSRPAWISIFCVCMSAIQGGYEN
jgi:hypothetical protein